MAKITHVKHAQQRYETVPVIDPETGQPKQTPVMRNGKQRMTKRGKPIFMTVTINDKTKPLPNRKCGKCGVEIKVGDPYKHTSPKSGPYGGRTLYRCESCPNWQVWEYSSSMSARLAQIQHEAWETFDNTTFESQDDVTSWLEDVASQVRELAEEKEEGAQNIEDGFGHETQMSEELRETAEQLSQWADDIEGADVPDYPEVEEVDCEQCDGAGQVENEEHTQLIEDVEADKTHLHSLVKQWVRSWADKTDLGVEISKKLKAEIQMTKNNLRSNIEALENSEEEIDCMECEGTGQVEGEEPTEEQISEWLDGVRDAVSVVDDCPV